LFGRAAQGIAVEDPLHAFAKANAVAERSLRAWCTRHQAQYQVVDDINGSVAVGILQRLAADAVIYAGGGILRQPFLAAAQHRVLNPHCGPLPEIRGMNAIEWAVLLGYKPAITVHYIDAGIDTGRIVSRVEIPLIGGEPLDSLRSRAVVRGIEELVAKLAAVESLHQLETSGNNGAASRQCYVMAPALRELLQIKLNQIDS
jgi:methionyl-tRNA formyltransferase